MALKVLIVEDNFIIQMFLESIINEMGQIVVGTASASDEAIVNIKEHSPDLILLDVGLSGEKDGIDTAQIIKDEFKIPVVFITGNSDAATLEKAQKTGPVHIVYKPIDEYKLRAEFQTIFKKLILSS